MSDPREDLETRPLHPEFGVEIMGVDLNAVIADHLYPAIRAAFEDHSLLLFRNQSLDDAGHKRLAKLFGPLEDRTDNEDEDEFVVPTVSNRLKDGTISGEMDLHTLNLKANQLWHTDSTFLPVPSLANIITARVVTSTGGETELVSTRAAWNRLSEDAKAKLRGTALWHRYGHSRARVSEELANQQLFTKWPDVAWRPVWKNPTTGAEALYIASHAYAVDGMDDAEGSALIDDLIARATTSDHIYTHHWQVGDVLIWDERATLHRGRPWPYEEERTLSSICVSAGAADGLETVRWPAAAGNAA
ncbi:MAG: TauD/TfdA family dioxygenase [Pseudomonadota bacterium]